MPLFLFRLDFLAHNRNFLRAHRRKAPDRRDKEEREKRKLLLSPRVHTHKTLSPREREALTLSPREREALTLSRWERDSDLTSFLTSWAAVGRLF
jgi:hypothetical protein